jgi:hypothetical protein
MKPGVPAEGGAGGAAGELMGGLLPTGQAGFCRSAWTEGRIGWMSGQYAAA